jgi:hypothetical protein
VAYNQGKVQSEIMDQVMETPGIEQKWDSKEVMDKILSLC